jgi:hypothetical protein
VGLFSDEGEPMAGQLSSEQQRVLLALQQGCHLKVHRTLDGAKVYRLHGAAAGGEDAAEEVAPGVVETLERRGYLQSNMKFPAAAYLLTERGAQAIEAPAALHPVGPRSY